jgi:hypothetical protein
MTNNSFLISLVSDEDDKLLGVCQFLSDTNKQVIYDGSRYHQITLYQCKPESVLLDFCVDGIKPKYYMNMYFLIVDDYGQVYARYFINVKLFVSARRDTVNTGCYDIDLLVLSPCRKEELLLYNDLIASYSVTPSRYHWSEKELSYKQSLLNVVRHHFCSGYYEEEIIDEGRVFEIDGEYIKDVPSFYLAMGEAIRGPYGYFGADLYAFQDCIFGVRRDITHSKFTLIWRNSDTSRVYLDKYSYQMHTVSELYNDMINLNYEHVIDLIIDDSELKPEHTFFDHVYAIMVGSGITVELR